MGAVRGRTYQRGKTWTYVVDLGPDPATGKRRQKTKGGFPRERDARAALNDLIHDVEHGTYVAPAGMTVATYLLDEWLPSRQVRQSTFATYRDAVEYRIVPVIGGMPLQALTPRHVSDLYAKLKSTPARRGKNRSLSARTIAYTGKVLTLALGDAVKQGLLARNPAVDVPRPKVEQEELKVWTPEQARAFLEAVGDDRLHGAWVLLLVTGMRRGEVLGLRWADLDLDRGRLAVRRTLVSVGYEVSWSEPKTPRSRRAVAIDPTTVAVLRAHRARQAEERLAIGPKYDDGDLVFCDVAGAPLHPKSLTDRFRRIVRALGLPTIRLHDLRHVAATVLLDEGVPLKVVSERLGHSNVGITANTYQHVLEHMQDDAAERAARALLR
jgi:integrase